MDLQHLIKFLGKIIEMTKINICSRSQVQMLLPSEDSILISITDPGKVHPRISKGWRFLRLKFHDLDQARNEEDRLISKKDATLILEFIKVTIPKEIIINCEAGISRSGGVAVALEEILNGDRKAFKKYPNHNRLVTTTILRVWQERLGED
jgi:predicted protein tyrosine phosphatase